MNSRGQFVVLDSDLGGELSASSGGITGITAVIGSALTGTLTLADVNGSTVLSKGSADGTGVFTVAGRVFGLKYALSNAADLGKVSVGYLPH